MQNKERTKKEIYKRFAIFTIGGMGVGFIIGFVGALLTDIYDGDLWGGLRELCTKVVPIAYVFIMGVGFFYCIRNYRKAKKLFFHREKGDESILDEIDKILDKALSPSNILMLCNFFFYSAMVYLSDIHSWEGSRKQIFFITFAIAVFVINKVILCVLQKRIVDFIKELNPEKRGEILDTEFQKVWLASCDEAEKQTIFEASYMAYRATSTACLVLWVLTLFGILLFDTGFFPTVCVFAIWLTMIVSYTIACHKLEKK